MEHKLKILPQYFKAVKEGTKTFEIRKNDRGFKVGDTLALEEWECLERGYTGQEITKEITYILEGGQCGLEKGYCILALKDIDPKEMQIKIKGTEKEIKAAKDVMDSTCILNSKYCDDKISCQECEKKHLKINYVIKESEEEK